MISTALIFCAAALFALPSRRAADRFRPLSETSSTPAPEAKAPDALAIAAGFDLFAACLRAGLPVADAATAIVDVVPTPMGTSLRRAADQLALGASPDTAWRPGAMDPSCESLARLARRSARSGSSLSLAISELAAEERGRAEDEAAAAAERAGVLIAGPLGLCFLPAFVCLGIVPVVIGLATKVLGNGLL